MTPTEAAHAFGTIARAIRSVDPDAYLVLGGSVSGQPIAWLEWVQAIEESGETIQAADIHPYAKDAPTARALIRAYHTLRPDFALMVFEWWREAAEIPAFVQMLNEECEAHTFFCFSDGMWSGMGLYTLSLIPTPEGHAMQTLIAAERPKERPMPEFVLGFKDYAEAHPEVGEPVTSEFDEFTYDDGESVDWTVRRQDTTTGRLYYYTESNTIVFQPFA